MDIVIRKPTVKDVDSIFAITNKMAERGLMLHRSKYKIVGMLASFLVAEDRESGRVVGSGAFSLLWTDLGEIFALAIDDGYQRKGIGSMIVRALLEEAERFRVPEVITLTYQPEFFKKQGFELSDKGSFPRKLWRECLECPKLEQCDETVLHKMMVRAEPHAGRGEQ
jgi:amino-acid N-acetyltransferase